MSKNILLLCTLALVSAGCVKQSTFDQASADLTIARAQVESLQKELAAAQRDLANAQAKAESDLAAVKEQVAALDSQLAESQAALKKTLAALDAKTAVPVRVTFRKASSGPGYIAIFNTFIKQDLSVKVAFTSKSVGVTKQFPLELSSNLPSEIGFTQGADIEPGDTLQITHPDYGPLIITVPAPVAQ